MQKAPDTATHMTDAMAYPTIPPSPGSPTLTNPDMILPDYDDSVSSPERFNPSFEMWKNAQPRDMQFDQFNQFDLTPHAFSGPVTPTTPIIYGNGTMLSDIGEVTEAESVCDPEKSRSIPARGNDGSKQTSATMTQESMRRKAHMSRERRASTDSTSTITTLERPDGAMFADFDDAVSVDDSNFQGDDEESVADSYIDDESVQEGPSPIRQRHPDGDSTALSRRAEQILANAKQRLTTMENNLSRARTIQSPTLSIGSESTPSPPLARPNTAINRENDSSYSSKPRFGHARISSENNLPTDLKPSTLSPRSSSALGAAGGYRPPSLLSRDMNHAIDSPGESPRDRASYGSSISPRNQLSPHILEPLSEDEPTSVIGSSRPSLENTSLDAFLNPTFGSYNELGLKRSASTAQMRDIKEQMNELKGRLSTLRDQARADSMKRRSLQTLRTPSPFTHSRVNQWYAAPKKAEDISPVPEDPAEQPPVENKSDVEENEARAKTPSQHESDESSAESRYTEVDEEAPRTELRPAELRAQINQEEIPAPALPDAQDEIEQVDVEDLKTEDGYQDEEMETSSYVDSASESGESYYHDTVQNQVSHEDREDAFDYEHFFLHSAMGSMSQRKLRRGSESSYSSDDSTETTRGPAVTVRPRRGSSASTSTMESFATATEGRNTRAEERARSAAMPTRVRSQTPNRAKRSTFEGADPIGMPRSQSSAATFPHHSSNSSLNSFGTNRSFPLGSRPKTNGGMLTPGDSPDQSLKAISESLMSDTASVCERENSDGDRSTSTIELLQRDEQILVERLVASLGKCVLGLAETGRASPESRMYRRRIEAAKRMLEGLEDST